MTSMSKEEFYKKILDNLPADIAILDNKLRYIYINKIAMPNDERRNWIIGKTDLEYCLYRGIDTSIAEGRAVLHKEAIESRVASKLEEEMVVDGRKTFNYRIMQPVFDNDGQLEFLLGYGLRMSEIRDKYEVVSKNLRLINSLNELLRRQVEKENVDLAFNKILDDVLELTNSGFGFIAETLYDENGQPYIRTKAVTNIAWNKETQQLYDDNKQRGMEFRNLNTIFGQVLITKKPYITNNPATDKHAAGTPHGHPPLNSFIGIPFMHGEELIGMIGLANKAGGYTDIDLEYLTPLTQTLSIVLKSIKLYSENKSILGIIKSKEEEVFELIKNLKDIVVKLDLNYNIIDLSSEIEAITGIKRNTMLGNNFSEFINYKEDREDFKNKVDGLLKDFGGNFTATYKFKVDNIEKFFEVKFSVLAQGGIKYLLGRLSDITGEIESLNKLNELAMVTEKTQNTVIIADTSGRVKWVNAAFTELLGYTLDEVAGKTPFEFLQYANETEDMTQQAIVAMKARKPFSGEIINYTKDRRKIWVYVNFVFFKDRDGNERILSVASDITKLKLAEAEIVRSLNNEINSNKLKSKFVSLVSHEFRTPLATIQSSIDLFRLKLQKTKSKAGDDFDETYNTIVSEIARLTELMNTFLIKEKLSQTNVSPNYSLIDLNSFYTDIINDINTANPVNVTLNLPETSRMGNVDLFIMQIILQNIISNAVKYSENSLQPPKFSIIYNENDYTLELEDYGIGIPETDMPHIFNAFYRAPNVDNIKGTGIGLNIVKEYVSALGGSININSKQFTGTNVKIILPY